MADWKTIRTWPKRRMLKRVARFARLKGSDGGLPDSKLPECRRKLYAVIGFAPPKSRGGATTSPVGDYASSMPAIPIAEGFNLGYCKARPGKGPLMHNHDTNETFIALTGRWRCEWNEGRAKRHVDLKPYDVISFPTGVARRFMNVTWREPQREHLLMFVIGGNQPKAEFTPRAMARCEEYVRSRGSSSSRARSAPARRRSSRRTRSRRAR